MQDSINKIKCSNSWLRIFLENQIRRCWFVQNCGPSLGSRGLPNLLFSRVHRLLVPGRLLMPTRTGASSPMNGILEVSIFAYKSKTFVIMSSCFPLHTYVGGQWGEFENNPIIHLHNINKFLTRKEERSLFNSYFKFIIIKGTSAEYNDDNIFLKIQSWLIIISIPQKADEFLWLSQKIYWRPTKYEGPN